MDIITVEKRDPTTKAKKLRRLGFVPCNVFGGTLQESISMQMDEADARKLIRMKREGSKLQLSLAGQVIPVQIKEKAYNVLNDEIVHISFQALQPNQKINSVIHIMLKNADNTTGIPETMLFEIPYASLPADMIDTITIDLENIPVGSILTINDIPELKSEKIELQIDADSMVLRLNDKKRSAAQPAESS